VSLGALVRTLLRALAGRCFIVSPTGSVALKLRGRCAVMQKAGRCSKAALCAHRWLCCAMPGCTAVARLLSECTTLRRLDLAGNHIGCDGARALLPALHVRDWLVALCENLLNCLRFNSSA
jgi:hypothetical protein